ncbi:hypothetical protein ONZ43_g4321 [Nemania bipapillata]|uniref:Uncharacterized protein n=1 Tax=Nemania bipapillata TaxID=110536 RepID=A0ACC2IP84_9PEZI|nr:hypothetical protein ONZ43_g4321 [Nemania bipapillata]
MADELKSTEGLRKRQPCREFIESRLPKYHPAFANPHVRFNSYLDQYEPIPPPKSPKKSDIMKQPEELDLLPDSSASESTQQPFWERMLPDAMTQLKLNRDEPSRLAGTNNSIRSLTGWAEIISTLEVARARMTDHVDDGKMLLSLLPDTEYTSLIHCVFDVIFDAAKRTAEIREEVEDSLRQFREKLEDVEAVVAIFDTDEDVIAAAIQVLVSVLQAIEDIVDYYSTETRRKVTQALWRGSNYKADLSDCLSQIDASSKKLIEKANVSNFREIHRVSIKASEGLEKLKALELGQLELLKEQSRLADAQEQMAKDGQTIRVKQQKLAASLSREASANARNAAANEMNAAANLENAKTSALALNGVQRLFKEYVVMMSENERMKRLNAQLEVKNAHLSSKLIAERSRSRGRRPSPAPEPVSQDQLLQILDMPNAEESDIAHISNSVTLVDRRDQGQAENLVVDPQFRQWVVQTRSTELLVHGYMKPSRTTVSALSLFSAALVQNLQTVDRFCVVAFFCGQHNDFEDPLAGGVGLIKSLTTQLLHQHQFSRMGLARVAREVNLPLLESGFEDIEELCLLFGSLVRQLPSTVTLFCVLDSVNVYENPEYMQEMHVEKVLYEVLSLTQDRRVQTHVKILLTSPTDTTTIRTGFKEKDILSMVGQPRMDKRFDDERFARHVDGAFGS